MTYIKNNKKYTKINSFDLVSPVCSTTRCVDIPFYRYTIENLPVTVKSIQKQEFIIYAQRDGVITRLLVSFLHLVLYDSTSYIYTINYIHCTISDINARTRQEQTIYYFPPRKKTFNH